jgi:hypothetical protein
MPIDIQNLQLDSKDQEKYLEKTNLDQHYSQIEETIESGTLKITQELAAQAKYALQSRIDATKDFTNKRVDRINKNYLIYNQKENNSDSLSQAIYPATTNAVEDWVDDLYLTFSKLEDNVHIEGNNDVLEDFIIKSLEKTGLEDNAVLSKIRSLIKNVLGNVVRSEKSVYYFKKKEVIKKLLKQLIEKSKFKENLEDFLYIGINGGEFCFKGNWGEDKQYKLQVHEETDSKNEYIKMGNFKYAIEKEYFYMFKPIDTRLLIYRQFKRKWVIEIIRTTFWELLEDTLDEKGKPRKNATYDIRILNQVKELLKDNEDSIDISYDELDAEQTDLSEIYKIDGDLEVYEAHNIPLILDGKPVNCLITAIHKNEDIIPIRIQPTPYIDLPYKFADFGKGGVGLPELIEKLQDILNDYQGYSTDMMNMSIWGVVAGDIDKFEDPEKVSKIRARDFIQLKNLKGGGLKEAFEWLHPPVDVLPVMERMFGIVLDVLNRTTRKGPSGQKIVPNPSATEVASIIQELQKSVNRVVVRLTILFNEMIKNMYIYTLINRNSMFNLKLNSFSTKQTEGQLEELTGNDISQVIRELEVSPKELLVDNIGFKINAMDLDTNKQAIEKQQTMQAIKLLFEIGAFTKQEQTVGPEGKPVVTEVPRTYIDDTGTEVVLDLYKLLSSFMTKSGLEDAWTTKQEKQLKENIAAAPANNLPVGGVAPTNPQNVAPLDASTRPSDLLSGAIKT